MKPDSYGADYANTQIQSSKNAFRRFVRSFYLRDILKHVSGPTLDFGCGAGDMLALLPPGSQGLDINPYAIKHCQARGLNAELYDPGDDAYQLANISPGRFKTLLLTHVIEHLDRPETILRELFHACERIGIHRIVLTVPCMRGFRFDPTHKTFVDLAYMKKHGLWNGAYFSVTKWSYFPLNMEWIGKFYTFHELRVVFDKISTSPPNPKAL